MVKMNNLSKKERKKIKKNKIIERQFNDDNNETSRMIKISIGVIAFFAIVYFIIAFATGEIKFGKEKTVTNIQYEEIQIEQTFKQQDSAYFVLCYDSTDDNKESLIYLLTDRLKETAPVYKVDLSKSYNKNHLVDDESKVKATSDNISELKVVYPTLIKVSNGKSVKLVAGFDNIKKYVK